MVEAVLEGGQGVFGAEATAATVGGDVEGGEVGGGFGVGGGFLLEDGLEDVGAVGDDAVDAEVDEGAHFGGVVGGPGDDFESGGVELRDVDGRVGAEEGGVDRREDGSERAVGLGVGVGGGHEGEERVHRSRCRGLLGGGEAGSEYKRGEGDFRCVHGLEIRSIVLRGG